MERFLRWALVASVVVGVQVAITAGSEAWVALNLDAPPIVRDDFFGPELGISADAQRDIWLAGVSGQRTALHNMQPWRVGTLALLEHEGAESGLINLQARFLGHLQSQVDREAVRVMEGEGFGTGQRNAGSLGFRYGIFQPCGA